MMRKKGWLIGLFAVVLCLATASCSKEAGGSSNKQELAENFKALVMGGRDIDTLQNWNTVRNLSIKINVDMGDAADYTVYILPAPALFDTEATYLGMARVKSGSSKTISVPIPAAGSDILYAACFNSEDHAFCLPISISASSAEVTFSGKHLTDMTTGESATSARWRVPDVEMPDLSNYSLGSFVEVPRLESEPDDNTRLSISSDYSGNVPSLNSHSGMVLYVGATWTLSSDLDLAHGNIIVVGNGGHIVIPDGITLTASADEGMSQIHVMANGKITGEGTLVYATASTCFNEGDISVRNIQVNDGTLYNHGTIGSVAATTSLTCNSGDGSNNGMFVNWGHATFKTFGGNHFAIQNAGELIVTDAATISAESRLSDNSYTECHSLTLNGDSDGSHIIYMGNSATIVANDISINNFGIWGPSGDQYTSNAIVKIDRCSRCITTSGMEGTGLLDHVELVLPEDFNATLNKGNLSAEASLLHYWLNAFDGGNGNNTNRQTCTYSTSPSFDTDYLPRGISVAPEYNAVYYAFETPVDNRRDFDYNDVVLRVGVPVDRGDGTYVSNVQLMCVGNTIKTTVLLDGVDFGNEVHTAAGSLYNRTVNNSSIKRFFVRLGEIVFTDSQARIDQLNFSIKTEEEEGVFTVLENGETPLYIVVNGSNDRRWFWPAEGCNIGVAYPQFSNWGANRLTATDWYDSSHAVSTKVVQWTPEDE